MYIVKISKINPNKYESTNHLTSLYPLTEHGPVFSTKMALNTFIQPMNSKKKKKKVFPINIHPAPHLRNGTFFSVAPKYHEVAKNGKKDTISST